MRSYTCSGCLKGSDRHDLTTHTRRISQQISPPTRERSPPRLPCLCAHPCVRRTWRPSGSSATFASRLCFSSGKQIPKIQRITASYTCRTTDTNAAVILVLVQPCRCLVVHRRRGHAGFDLTTVTATGKIRHRWEEQVALAAGNLSACRFTGGAIATMKNDTKEEGHRIKELQRDEQAESRNGKELNKEVTLQVGWTPWAALMADCDGHWIFCQIEVWNGIIQFFMYSIQDKLS